MAVASVPFFRYFLPSERAKALGSAISVDAQPEYVEVDHRGRRLDFLVVHGNRTHLGCIPNQDVDQGKSLVGSWSHGGFVCACYFSMYDYAGRVVRGPAPTNLPVPPH